MPPMHMIRKNPNGIFWSSHLLWIIQCQEANSPLRDAAIPPSHRAVRSRWWLRKMHWTWDDLDLHQVSSSTIFTYYGLPPQKKSSKRCGPVADTKLSHASWHTSNCHQHENSRVKLETQAASFANDTIEIHRISSYTTLPMSKNYIDLTPTKKTMSILMSIHFSRCMPMLSGSISIYFHQRLVPLLQFLAPSTLRSPRWPLWRSQIWVHGAAAPAHRKNHLEEKVPSMERVKRRKWMGKSMIFLQ